ncbi:hypothetical protein EBZ37_10955 [bacterium]|nr:hypothetical protein [bacterium]
MWVALKLVIASIAFSFRLIVRFLSTSTGSLNGMPYRLNLKKVKSGAIVSTSLGIPLQFPALFEIRHEQPSDQLWKRLGLSGEFQTGDLGFDQAYYLFSDHTGLNRELAQSENLRAKVLDILGSLQEKKAIKLSFDGKWLSVERPGRIAVLEDEVKQLLVLKELLLHSQLSVEPFWKDPYFKKLLVFEALSWALLAYAVLEYIERDVAVADVHLDSVKFTQWVIGGMILVFGGYSSMYLMLMRGASRFHQGLMEALVILIFSTPLVALGVVSDVNREWDESAREEVRWEVRRVTEHVHRTRKRTWRSYHMLLGAKLDGQLEVRGLAPGQWLQIDSVKYSAAQGKGSVWVSVGQGTLGIPWVRAMKFE